MTGGGASPFRGGLKSENIAFKQLPIYNSFQFFIYWKEFVSFVESPLRTKETAEAIKASRTPYPRGFLLERKQNLCFITPNVGLHFLKI